MLKKIIIIFFATLAILITGCECVTNIPGEQIIKPTEFAKIVFINAIPEYDFDTLYVYSASQIIGLKDTIEFNQNDKYEYKEVGIKVGGQKNSLRLVEPKDSLVIFNSILNLEKNHKYTFFAYGIGNDIQSILLEDTIQQYVETNVYLRCINISPDLPETLIRIETEGYSRDFYLSSGDYSEIASLPSGNYTIFVSTNDSLFTTTINNVKFDKGKINNVILEGYHYGFHDINEQIHFAIVDYKN